MTKIRTVTVKGVPEEAKLSVFTQTADGKLKPLSEDVEVKTVAAAQKETINYKELLKKYFQIVYGAEDCTYLAFRDPGVGTDGVEKQTQSLQNFKRLLMNWGLRANVT